MNYRMKVKQEGLMPLQHYLTTKAEMTCGSCKIYSLIFGLNNSISLYCEINKRTVKNMLFSEKELLEGLESLAKGLVTIG